MESVSQFDDKNPNILGHRHNHFAHSFSFSRFTKRDSIKLGHAINK